MKNAKMKYLTIKKNNKKKKKKIIQEWKNTESSKNEEKFQKDGNLKNQR